ncbi:MAG: response regulator, partial [Prolixibacteraceae bacterium]|nr:response regulator [Prolixibacteraceae bacterium]
SNGADALQQFNKQRPDLVILDISLPSKNGIELLKELLELKPDVLIYMFTNYPYPHFKSACLKSGAKEFFDKSSDFEALIAKIENQAKQFKISNNIKNMSRILVVDDSSSMRKMVIASLRIIPGTSFSEASNGLEAIEKLSLQHFDAIMLDMNMPDMNGMEVLHFIRNQYLYRQIPVIVLTTRSDEQLKTSATEAGATLYLNKPFDPRILAQKVSTILKDQPHD